MAGRCGQVGTDKAKSFQHFSNRNFQKLLHAPRHRYKVAGATPPGGLDQSRSQCGQPAPPQSRPLPEQRSSFRDPRPRAPRLLTSLPSEVHVEEDSRVAGVGGLSLGGWMRHCSLRTRVRPPRNTAWSPWSSNPKVTGRRRTAALVSRFRLGAGGRGRLSGTASQLPAARSDFRLRRPWVRWRLSPRGWFHAFWAGFPLFSRSVKLQAQLFFPIARVSGERCQAVNPFHLGAPLSGEGPAVWKSVCLGNRAGNAHVRGRRRVETVALSTRLAAQLAGASRWSLCGGSRAVIRVSYLATWTVSGGRAEDSWFSCLVDRPLSLRGWGVGGGVGCCVQVSNFAAWPHTHFLIKLNSEEEWRCGPYHFIIF